MTGGSRIKISQLIPGTTYLFKVSAITERGRGAEVDLVGQTDRPQSIEGELSSGHLSHSCSMEATCTHLRINSSSKIMTYYM